MKTSTWICLFYYFYYWICRFSATKVFTWQNKLYKLKQVLEMAFPKWVIYSIQKVNKMERVAEKERSSYKKKNICIHSNWLCVVDVVYILSFLSFTTYMEYGNLVSWFQRFLGY